MALVMIVGVFSPLTALAEGYEAPSSTFKDTDVATEKPDSTKVIVHKLQADSYYTEVKNGLPHDGGQITNIEGLGKNVKELDGVTFTYYKLKDEKQLAEFMTAKPATAAAVTAKDSTLTVAGTITTANGAGASVDLTDGYYWFIETGKPATVSSSIAVPFGISIPLPNQVKIGTHEVGTVYLKNVHIYPKNVTGNEPDSDKTVENLVNKHATKDVGSEVLWHLNSTLPANFKDYKKFVFKDSLDDALTYAGNIKVRFGSGDNATNFTDLANELVETTDYVVKTYSDKAYTTTTTTTEADVRSFTVELTPAGIEKIGNAVGNITNPKISVEFKSILNDKAKVGTGNPNEYTLVWNNGNDTDKEKKSDEPKVFTGKRIFVKSDDSTKDVLAGAVFIVQNAIDSANIKYLVKDANGNVSWDTDKTKATHFTSGADGKFEVGKLQFSNKVKGIPTSLDAVEFEKDQSGNLIPVNKYQLVEIQAPKGFARIENPIDFTIDNTSHEKGDVKINQGKVEVNEAAGEFTNVPNKKLTIPQTGGIGTVIFTVVGVGLMAGAVIAMKKNREEA